jgi:CrcB protein
MLWLKSLIFIAMGGATGAVLRFLFSEFVHLFFDRSFPVGILLTNILGSLLMGYLGIVLFERLPHAADLRSFVLIGLLGAFTTFSTFSMDTVKLIQGGHLISAGLNMVLSVVLCVIAAGVGVYLARIIG